MGGTRARPLGEWWEDRWPHIPWRGEGKGKARAAWRARGAGDEKLACAEPAARSRLQVSVESLRVVSCSGNRAKPIGAGAEIQAQLGSGSARRHRLWLYALSSGMTRSDVCGGWSMLFGSNVMPMAESCTDAIGI